jgi:hypothetical protein
VRRRGIRVFHRSAAACPNFLSRNSAAAGQSSIFVQAHRRVLGFPELLHSSRFFFSCNEFSAAGSFPSSRRFRVPSFRRLVGLAFSSASPLHLPLIRGSTVRRCPTRPLLLNFSAASGDYLLLEYSRCPICKSSPRVFFSVSLSRTQERWACSSVHNPSRGVDFPSQLVVVHRPVFFDRFLLAGSSDSLGWMDTTVTRSRLQFAKGKHMCDGL